ncbi:short-chain dehydrogenase [Thalassorhabdomicrobium marinisediminis]|uniref:Short-chain dehydrogenase n=1 Tax=Thalassorhabdomicrobium marinisediminis TaxID=2170577 RepID=A0A2T7FUR0_9RHOB|nr:short-chain dehydrogenase [Thalassorhabdomicrobium marinisediminis]
MLQVAGKVALITGGGVGIGRATADLFAESGLQLAIAENDPARVENLRKALPDALVVAADVRDRDDVAKLIKAVRDRFGRLDVLVNNVGDFLRITSYFEDSTEEEWEALYAVNLLHMFRVTKAALPLMKSSGAGGSIINLSSVEAFRGIPRACVYAAFKSGITGFTQSLASELGADRIRVNAIASETTDSAQITADTRVPKANRKHIATWFPLGRFGRGEDSAGAALYLASDRLSGWVTGTSMVVDGGVLSAGAWMRMPDGSGNWTHLPIIAADGYTEIE